MESFGKICLSVIILFLTALIGGVVFMTLWQWFIIPVFKIQAVSLAQSIGLCLFIGHLKPKPKPDEDEDTVEKLNKEFIRVIVFALFILVAGWVITQFL